MSEFEPCTTLAGDKMHLRRVTTPQRTLCGLSALGQEDVAMRFRRKVITNLAACRSCARAGGLLTVQFTDDQIGALDALLSLVHYDDLAASWRALLPRELLAALAASHSTQPTEEETNR